ncbi:MAG TPA: ATP cone domain-containing protein [bacterium]|nr:ATP cone domain-containing protein [bacterium]
MEKKENSKIQFVKKRDGTVVPFEKKKIADAIFKALRSTGVEDRLLADELAASVTLYLNKEYGGTVPDIEKIQDLVERVLMEMGQVDTAKSYILYREKRAQLRRIMDHVQPGIPSDQIVWDRKRIVNALAAQLSLPFILAEKIADIVEDNIAPGGHIPPEQLSLSIN